MDHASHIPYGVGGPQRRSRVELCFDEEVLPACVSLPDEPEQKHCDGAGKRLSRHVLLLSDFVANFDSIEDTYQFISIALPYLSLAGTDAHRGLAVALEEARRGAADSGAVPIVRKAQRRS